MSGLDSIISVVISRQTSGVSQVGFGIPMILGPNAAYTGVRVYSSLTAVAVDFTSGMDEYKAAAAIFEQTPSPTQVNIAKRQATVAGVYTLTPTVANTAAYTVAINGVSYTITSGGSATASAIVSALIAVINADSACLMIASGSTTLILTAKNAGQGNSVSAITTNLTVVVTTPKVGVAEDIVLYDNQNPSWYCLILTSRAVVDQLDAAAQIEAMKRIFVTCGNTTDIYAAGTTTDIGSIFNSKNYKRTALLYSGDMANFPDAAWAGQMLPQIPGSENWAFKTLIGNTADALSDTQTGALDSKWVNYYVVRGGVSVTYNGRVSGQDYIDITRGIDWLYATIQANIYGQLVGTLKIPLTDTGIAVIEAQLRAALQLGVKNGFLLSYTVSVPLAASLSTASKAARQLTGVTFVAVVAGAIDSLTINGTVTL